MMLSHAEKVAEKHRITAVAEPGEENPDWDTPHTAWKVTLRYRRRKMTVPFYMGIAHQREPEAGDVLECLASDASSVDNTLGFEDWCNDYGYSADSRKAERTYDACVEVTARLKKLLGEEIYKELVYDD